MCKFITVLIIGVFFSLSVYADNGIVKIKSAYTVENTMNRLEVALKEKGMTIFSRINHASGAKSVGKELRPTQLLIFGNPEIGTKLMQCKQAIGIDLPLKALVFEGEAGQVWLTYNNPTYIAARHSMNNCGEIITKIGKALSNFAKVATLN